MHPAHQPEERPPETPTTIAMRQHLAQDAQQRRYSDPVLRAMMQAIDNQAGAAGEENDTPQSTVAEPTL